MEIQEPLNAYLQSLIREIVREVVSECGAATPIKLYDAETAAAMLSVPKRWLYEKTAKDEIPHRHVGKYVRFSDADLRAIAGRGE